MGIDKIDYRGAGLDVTKWWSPCLIHVSILGSICSTDVCSLSHAGYQLICLSTRGLSKVYLKTVTYGPMLVKQKILFFEMSVEGMCELKMTDYPIG